MPCRVSDEAFELLWRVGVYVMLECSMLEQSFPLV